ncbi:ABC transporter permease [Clostridium senegalense]|uniref:ABC transporter permease n=1 Tax=Clostridium senegalense TaxID=1465809 RepID=A0A6M0H2B3_9CLOT|nr:ABC transporter permease [Clostridium senegalense]NEU04865.1 ABC transporter permease [Clostridium senegalense]
MIWKNFLKDLIDVTSRLISVIIIIIIAVMVYVGLDGITYNGSLIVDNYFNEQNVADYWITGNGFDENDCRYLKGIDGINEVESRLVFEASENNNENIKLSLYGVDNDSSINKPYIIEGRLPENNEEMMISSEFAKKQGLNLGDEYSIKILGTKNEIKFKISALIKNPERMHNISPIMPSPDYSKYGFAYINKEAISNVLKEGKYNQIVITLDSDADNEKIKNDIIENFDSKIINIVSLEDNVNTNNLQEFINGIKPITKGLPLIFFVIAALLMVSTMSRLIENSRLAIGTLKALGYTDLKILLYYFMYAFIVVVFGFMIGGVLSKIIITKPLFKILFGLNDLPYYIITYNKVALMKAFILTAISCMGTSIIITRKALKENPARCMRPKLPKKERKLLMERIKFIWSRLGFNKKYIIKNTFRNKGRVFTCIVGIAVCMALVLTCLGLKDSINNFTNNIIKNQHRYDMYMTLNTKIKEYNIDKVNELEEIETAQYNMNTRAIIMKNGKQDIINMIVSEDTTDLKLIDTYDENINLPKEGIIINDTLAKDYNLPIGDYVDIKFYGKEDTRKVKISDINSNINGAYIGKTYFEKNGEIFTPDYVYVKTSNIEDLETDIENIDFITEYELKENITDGIISKVSLTSLVVYNLIIVGGILAMVVLYNLGIMSFYEQIRSLATLKVLGFYEKEIKKLQLTENIIFTIFGIIIGMPLGNALINVITRKMTLANLQPATSISSYIIAILLTVTFAYIVNVIIGRMMRKIDMLGALKSVE